MNSPATTALTVDSFDGALDSSAHQSRSRVLARGLVPSQLRRLGGGIGVIALAPFLIAAMSALALMFLAKLVFALVAVGFESSQRDQTAQITHTKSRRPVKKELL